jgi:hypothetical protein
MKEKKQFDVFVSYRRTSYDTANLIAEKLRHAGYSVFFDIDTLTAGKFNEQLLEVIRSCKDFILVLPEGALDRCSDPQDWIRREVTCAIENHKNLIPVMLDGFVWPNPLPAGMEELPLFQDITATQHEYFDMAMSRLQGYLKSKSSKPMKQWLAKGVIVLSILLVLLAVGIGILYHVAGVTTQEVGKAMSMSMGVMNSVGEDCKDIKEVYQNYINSIDKGATNEGCQKAEMTVEKVLRKYEKDVASWRKQYPDPNFDLNGVEAFIMGHYGLGREELKAFAGYYGSVFDDMETLLSNIRQMIEEHNFSIQNRDIINLGFSGITHSLNAFYYGYLGSISLLPKPSRKTHYEMSEKWTVFPNGTPLDLEQEQYEQFQMNELFRYNEEIDRSKEIISSDIGVE